MPTEPTETMPVPKPTTKPSNTNGMPKTNTLAIVGFITSLIIYPVGFVLSIIALVQIRKRGEGGRGLAIAGTIIGSIGTIFALVLLSLVIYVSGLVAKQTAAAVKVSDAYMEAVQAQDGATAFAMETANAQKAANPEQLTATFQAYRLNGQRTIVAKSTNTVQGLHTISIIYTFTDSSPKYAKVIVAQIGSIWMVSNLVTSDSLDNLKITDSAETTIRH